MKKPLIILVVLAVIAVTIFYVWSARLAEQKSNELMLKFKTVDSSLASSDNSVSTQGGIGAIQEGYGMSSVKSQLILLIDSLKENYENSSRDLKRAKSTNELRLDTKRLLSYLQDYNQLIKTAVVSQKSDTIKYDSGLSKFNEQKWQFDYFEGVPKEVSITYLNYLRNQLK